MMRRRWLVILLLTGSATLLVAAWVLQNYRLEVYEIKQPDIGEAARHALLAAERFLHRVGIEARTVRLSRLIDAMPAVSDTILIDSNRYQQRTDSDERLLDWVRAGGQLVLRPAYHEAHSQQEALYDPLLERLGIRVLPIDIEPDEVPTAWPADSKDAASEPLTLYLDIDSYTRLEGAQPGDGVARNNTGVQLIRRSIGLGTVTVLTDLGFIDNAHIGDQDHALGLWRLVHRAPGARVWLVHDKDFLSLPSLLWLHFPELIVVTATMLALWLWGAAQRFGPIATEGENTHRSILEHIAASGRHAWRQGRGDLLLDHMRQSLLDRMARRHRGWTQLTSEHQYRTLAAISGWPITEIQRLMTEPAGQDRDAFTRLTRQLQALRNKL